MCYSFLSSVCPSELPLLLCSGPQNTDPSELCQWALLPSDFCWIDQWETLRENWEIERQWKHICPELLPYWVSEAQKVEYDSLSETTAPAGGPLCTAPSGEPRDFSLLDFLQASGWWSLPTVTSPTVLNYPLLISQNLPIPLWIVPLLNSPH